MSRFPSATHLARWARLCPGNHESAGKRYSGRTGSGNVWLRSGLIQAAHAAVKCKTTYLAAVYRRLAPRRGKKRAIVAVRARMLIAAYHILLHREPYRDLGSQYLDERRQEIFSQANVSSDAPVGLQRCFRTAFYYLSYNLPLFSRQFAPV